ncbi:thiamine pyrophosphokinase [Clostridiales bacterium]|nr:thiamine pyrophosphokinase [Clostridiales bacterium]
MKAVVFANADINDYKFCDDYVKDAVIICCDGGMRHTMKIGIDPDYIVGDFDSVPADVLDYYEKKNIELKQVPCRKDETDLELGISHAIEIGADDITIIGGIGSRMDHTIANVFQLIRMNRLGIVGRLVNENNLITLSTGKCEIDGKKGDIVSFIPITPTAVGVTTSGLEYPLNKATLYMDSPLGVSNVMEGSHASYDFDEGMALVIKAKD